MIIWSAHLLLGPGVTGDGAGGVTYPLLVVGTIGLGVGTGPG